MNKQESEKGKEIKTPTFFIHAAYLPFPLDILRNIVYISGLLFSHIDLNNVISRALKLHGAIYTVYYVIVPLRLYSLYSNFEFFSHFFEMEELELKSFCLLSGYFCD